MPNTVVTPTPFIMKDAVVSLGTNDFQAACSSAALNPTVPSQVFKGLTPASIFPVAGAPTWTLDLTFAQSLAATDLARYLLTNSGVTVPFTLTPKSGGASFSGNVVVVPGAFGGDIDTIPTSTVSLMVVGQPAVA